MSQRDEGKGRILYEGTKFDIRLKTVEGRSGAKTEKPYIHHPGAVVLIPETSNGGLILIENRRFAVEETILEVPAGTLHWGEDPVEAAHRELEEETGWRASTLVPVMTYFSAPAFTNEVMHVFLAQDLQRGVLNPDDDEEIRVVEFSREQADSLLTDGKVRDGKTLLALALWKDLRED